MDLGVNAIMLAGNVADAASIQAMAQEFNQRFSKLDILVNNAASGVLKPTLAMSVKHWRWCLETNALSLPLLLQQFKPLMPPGARVFALSSLGAARSIPDYAFIGASKAALESLVRSLAVELAPAGISVNTISAGAVDTDALKQFPQHDFVIQQALERSLAGRTLTPEDVADVLYLLCLPEAAMIRGQTIVVDAGYSIIA
jgi:enoyl-[acyl-carrier protein] reductase III